MRAAVNKMVLSTALEWWKTSMSNIPQNTLTLAITNTFEALMNHKHLSEKKIKNIKF